jgi:hypothetical protein
VQHQHGCPQAFAASSWVAYQTPPAAAKDWTHWDCVACVSWPFLQHQPGDAQALFASASVAYKVAFTSAACDEVPW